MARVLAKLALATSAAVGLYVPTLGLPLPDSCVGTVGVADAAPTPSRSCGGDLRECLRQSADLRQTALGGRYVTAEDVAMCVEAFNACAHGTLQRGSNPPTSTNPESRTETADLPKRFGIDHGGGAVSDCRVSGDSTTTCTANWKTANDSYNAEFTGTLSGLTLTGTTTTRRSGHAPDDPGCAIDETYSGPVTYVFSSGGGATFTAGPNQRRATFSGSCSGSNSGMTDMMKGTATWSATR